MGDNIDEQEREGDVIAPKRVVVINPDDSRKCELCAKTVYRAEEIKAVDGVWHVDCFVCGGSSENGCKKKLKLGNFKCADKIPYCNICGDRYVNDVKLVSHNASAGSADEEDVIPAKNPFAYAPGETDFQSYELPDSFGKPAKSSAADKFRRLQEKTECPACSKQVYKAEELVALGSTWHKSCFTCGGSGDLGCKRKLALGTFRVHEKLPYCDACINKIARENNSKPVAAAEPVKHDAPEVSTGEESIVSSGPDTSNQNQKFYDYDYSTINGIGEKPKSAAADKFRSAGNKTTCPVCSKSVYKAEELVALGSTWHQACFTCGGTSDQGCKRRLALGTFQVHNGTQYCSACCDRIAKDTYSKSVVSTTAGTGSNDASDSEPQAPMSADQVSNIDYNYDYSGGFGKSKPPSVNKFANMNANKCPACSKTVYKAEELVALNASWHAGCFTCGGSNENGCKRRLALGAFQVMQGVQYCNACADKVSKESYMKAPGSVSATRTVSTDLHDGIAAGPFSPTDQSSVDTTNYNYELSSGFGKTKPPSVNKFANMNANKCPACSKTVYKAEELVALNASWHAGCFTCGGSNENGCKRRLALGAFQVMQGVQYCNPCADRIAKDTYSRSVSKTDLSANSRGDSNVSEDDAEANSRTSSQDNQFISYELSDSHAGNNFKTSQVNRTASERFSRMASENSLKCPACSTTVFSAEQLVALNASWHPACFTCGGSGDLGCKRRLALGSYRAISKVPYCENCFGKVSKLEIAKTTVSASAEPTPSAASPYSFLSPQVPRINESAEGVSSNPSSPRSRIAELSQSFSKQSVDTVDYSGVSYSGEDSVNKRASLRKFQPVVNDANRCPVCTKEVYKHEQLLALGSPWHASCFLCGGKGESGCRKKLTLGEFAGESGNPYCKMCHDKLRSEANSKSVAAASAARDSSEVPSFTSPKYVAAAPTVSAAATSQDPSNMSYEMPLSTKKPVNEKFKFLGGGDSSKKCPICTKTVYAAEEVLLGTSSYHSACFTCGGKGDSGCKRKISSGEGQLFQSNPYCKFCFDRVAKSSIASFEKLDKGSTTPRSANSSAPSSPAHNKGESAVAAVSPPKDVASYPADPVAEVPASPASAESYSSVSVAAPTAEAPSVSLVSEPTVDMQPEVVAVPVEMAKEEPSHAEPESEPVPVVDDGPAPVESTIEPAAESTTIETPAESTAEPIAKEATNTDIPVEVADIPISAPVEEEVKVAAPAPEPTPEPVVIEKENSRSSANAQKPGYVEYTVKGVTYRGVRTEYEYDFDENGAIYYIGSEGKTKEFSNPHHAALVKARMSSTFKGEPSNLVSRDTNTAPTYTGNDPDSFVEIDLGAEHRLLIDKYTIRHGGAAKGNALRNWMLTAKVDKQSEWVLLRDHEEDERLSIAPRSTASWSVEFNPPDDLNHEHALGFRIFRITQTGPNSSGNDCLFCCGVELYGMLFKRV